ncbi:hypothetical protein [Tropicimonas sediminicola]|uniref:Uncharacterized protein n=1 Tax=Tropicimonas sediminicola TaxID=1031541 RepID=A0A239IYQ3_9RHOB|nr:hypothetical protein [Tropicimonas sediminicola]SNS98665.1 hypothetical protein SAMN05421757_10516 [Tropicimonas sediminicola]
MIRNLIAFFGLVGLPRAEGASAECEDEVDTGLASRMRALDRDPYLSIADPDLRLISVFDDLKYDRADLDMLTGPMRRRAVRGLEPLGFRQVSGAVIENRSADVRVVMPKQHSLGASPFDAARYLSRRSRDYVLLTPTQVACQFIDSYPVEDAVERIRVLVAKHPINLLKIADHLEHNDRHATFRPAIGHLKFVQREAVEAEPLRSRRALR